jgi:hypothetical protein
MSMDSHDGMIVTGESLRTRRKTCPNATKGTTNRTWTDLGSNPGLRNERLATNSLNHITALVLYYHFLCFLIYPLSFECLKKSLKSLRFEESIILRPLVKEGGPQTGNSSVYQM